MAKMTMDQVVTNIRGQRMAFQQIIGELDDLQASLDGDVVRQHRIHKVKNHLALMMHDVVAVMRNLE